MYITIFPILILSHSNENKIYTKLIMQLINKCFNSKIGTHYETDCQKKTLDVDYPAATNWLLVSCSPFI